MTSNDDQDTARTSKQETDGMRHSLRDSKIQKYLGEHSHNPSQINSLERQIRNAGYSEKQKIVIND